MKRFIFICVLALSVVFAGLQPALANTDGTNETTSETDTEKSDVAADEEAVEDEAVEDDTDKDSETEAPALVPGDMFYFIKIMIEKVRLAVTIDDYKEAKLLAQFAAERINEANALMEEGEKEKALELLQEAADTQKDAEDKADEVEVTTGDGTKVTVEVRDADGNIITDEPNSEESATIEVDQVVDNTDTEDQSTEDPEANELRGKLANNIDALLAALEKVDNPKAQAALLKNIEKTFAKLDKKISKQEEKDARKLEKQEDKKVEEEEETAEAEDATNEEKEEQPASRLKKKALEKDAIQDTKKEIKEEAKELRKEAKEQWREAKEEAKERAKEAREKAKENRKAAFEKAKEKRKAAQERAKQAKENGKGPHN